MTRLRNLFLGLLSVGLVLGASAAPNHPGDEAPMQDLKEILAQNRNLQEQVRSQQQQIDRLRLRLDELENHPVEKRPEPAVTKVEREEPVRLESPLFRSAREIRLSGEIGLAFFDTGKKGAFPNAEFLVDEARLFLEAPVWKNVYFFTGLELATREDGAGQLSIGELYADVEDVLAIGHAPRFTLNLRLGRFNIPFGEEYQSRSVMTNPLITHSVIDIWGIDEGVQLYGSLGPLSYNVAVQNGGEPANRDYNQDKSVTARLSIEPVKSLHVSVSGHRTGKLDVAKDSSSEVWFGGEYLGPVNMFADTGTFQASLLDIEAAWRWKQGHLSAAAGTMRVSDNPSAGNKTRKARFYSFELVQQITPKFYGAARFGEIRIRDGYPLVGLGDYGKLYYRSPPTESLHRLTLGVGYRFADPLLLKIEYSWEHGYFINDVARDDEAMFSTEIGLKF